MYNPIRRSIMMQSHFFDEAHGSESTLKFGDGLVEWATLAAASPLLMVFDHKLINYGLFWMSVSGLEIFSFSLSVCIFQFQFSYLSNVNVLLYFPSLWHTQFGLGQCLVFFLSLCLFHFLQKHYIYWFFRARNYFYRFLHLICYVLPFWACWLATYKLREEQFNLNSKSLYRHDHSN